MSVSEISPNNNQIFQSLWIGPSLSKMEQLCIKSFVDHNLEYHLYTYGEVKIYQKE